MKPRYFVLSAIVAIAVGVGGLFSFKLVSLDDLKKLWERIPISSLRSQSPGGYVAVYLTNGKVYFGKIEHPDSQEPVMSDVFFLNAATTNEMSKGTTSQPEFQLVRLADQFQAPNDRLTITRDHILYWEELADDSKVVQAIAKYHESQKK